MLSKIFKVFLPAILLCSLLATKHLIPRETGMADACISPHMPVGDELPGWKGKKTQESEAERRILAGDTRFSKAIYYQLPRVPWEKQTPAINVSIVYSGKSMSGSIHRPEVCLPAQGHMNLQTRTDTIELTNGNKLNFTRISSLTPYPDDQRKRLNFIHYYVFVGSTSIHHTHVARYIQDALDRIMHGRVQSWAYFQAGTCWGPEINVTEEDADRRLRKLISELLPGLINWESIK